MATAAAAQAAPHADLAHPPPLGSSPAPSSPQSARIAGFFHGAGSSLWIKLCFLAEQLPSYPHKNPPRQSCCLSASDFIQTSAHGFLQRKCAQTLRKMQLSTKKTLLYYYCYFNIKLLKNNLSTAGRQTGQGCEYLKSGGAVCGVWKKGRIGRRMGWACRHEPGQTLAGATLFLRQCPVLLLKNELIALAGKALACVLAEKRRCRRGAA